MKFLLIMTMCSQLAGECMNPHPHKRFDTFYDCVLGGYAEGDKKTQEIGRTEINEHQIIIKFQCYYDPKPTA